MRDALATLPWVEQQTIEPNRSTRDVRFGINDRNAFNEDEMKAALGRRYRSGMTVKEIRDVDKTP